MRSGADRLHQGGFPRRVGEDPEQPRQRVVEPSSRRQGRKPEKGDRGVRKRRSTVFTKDAYPAEWATTENNLGNTWLDSPTGVKAENLKRAIAAYEAALTVRTKKAYPAEWAMTQYNLGIAWGNLPTGAKSENLKKAIAAYDAVLTVFTKDAYPAEWGRTQNNLGDTWWDFSTGIKAGNLTKSIAAYEAVLAVHTKEAYPAGWARTQNKIAIAWSAPSDGGPDQKREEGDRNIRSGAHSGGQGGVSRRVGDDAAQSRRRLARATDRGH